MTDYRASLDAAVKFGNGGDLTVHGFRIDVPSADVGEAEIAALFIASLSLLMTDSVDLSNVHIFAEPHKGTRGGPSDHRLGLATTTGRLVELSDVIRAGMTTYPGLPGPAIDPHLTRQASRSHYAAGTEFAIDRLTLVGNTGTYLDSPYHRFADGADLSAISLEQTVDLPAVVVRVAGAAAGAGQPGIDVGALAALDVRGAAVLLHTGDDARFGTRLTPRTGTSSPRQAPAGSSTTAPHSSASMRSTSMTRPTVNDLHIRSCSPQASPSSST